MGKLVRAFDWAKTLEHPLAKAGLVGWVPTRWLFEISSRSTLGMTDLNPGDPNLVKLPFVWKNMKRQGMRDPFTIAVGANGTCRLEAGNHRVQLFLGANIEEVLGTVLVGDNCVVNVVNGKHQFRHPHNIPPRGYDLAYLSERVYRKPSDVFPCYDVNKIERLAMA